MGRGHEPALLGLSDEQLGTLNDDRVGRALDRLFDADVASLVLDVAAHAVREFGVGSTSCTTIPPPSPSTAITTPQPGVIPKCGHAAGRLARFAVEVCDISSSSTSSAFNSARQSGGVQRHALRRSRVIAS